MHILSRLIAMSRFFVLILGFTLGAPVCQAESFGPFRVVESGSASDLWVNAGFYSYHFQEDKGLNNSNPGWGVEYRHSNTGSAMAGVFFNSERKTSHYAGWYWQPLALGQVKFGAVLGVLDGYPRMRNGSWFLAIIPAASIEYERIGINVVLVPTYKDRLYGALSFQLKLKVD